MSGSRGQRADVPLPFDDRIGAIEPAQMADRFPQPGDLLIGRQRRKHFCRPFRAGRGDHRPVDIVSGNAFAKWLQAARRGPLHGGYPIGRLAGQQVGIVREDRQRRVTLVDMFDQRFRQPAGKIVE